MAECMSMGLVEQTLLNAHTVLFFPSNHARQGCPRCSHRESGPKKREVYSFVDTRENVRKLMADGRKKEDVKHITDVGAALRRMRQKKMQENKAMVTVYVKKVPSGEVVTLRLDVRSTMQYLYFMYRSNSGVEGLAPNMHLFLPVSTGIFYLNYSLEPATELRTEWCPGFFTLADLHITRG